MAVAWIGNREAELERAVEQAAALLVASRSPVILFDTDVDGTRAVIALAEAAGASCDLASGSTTFNEVALLTDKGTMTVAPGEARRRADVLVIVGDLPPAQHDFVADLAKARPDLNGGKPRKIFSIGSGKTPAVSGAAHLSATAGNMPMTLAALRAGLAGKRIAKPIRGLDEIEHAVKSAAFPVFIISGLTGDPLTLEMVVGLIGDINATKRAAILHLPSDENGWGSVLASGWSTGFAPRIGFARGRPEYDPWRYDVNRMLADGEADTVLWVGASPKRLPAGTTLIAISPIGRAVAGAEVTIAVGEPGRDHDTVGYQAQLGTLAFKAASQPSTLPSAASVIRQIHRVVREGSQP